VSWETYAGIRWSVVRCDQPVLAYSEHPVAIWPMNVERVPAVSTQQFGPVSALEVCFPLAPDVALLMDRVDRSDRHDISFEMSAASEFNAFTVAQADRAMDTPAGSRARPRRRNVGAPLAPC
jgi:hypothetical protein